MASEERNLRKDQGQQLKAALTKKRDEQLLSHPFTHVHASALHESGHAVMAVVLERQLCYLTVIQDDTGGGAVERQVKTGTPTELVEEMFITFAGYEAADIYDFCTNDSLDQVQTEKLKALLKGHACVDEQAARHAVRTFLKANHVVVEDLAAELFTEGTISGEVATVMVKEGLSTASGSIEAVKLAITKMLLQRSV